MIWLQFVMAASSNAAFSSIYIFGDSVSCTASNAVTGFSTNLYYGKRFSNGRTWVEVLAQRQGLGANSLTNAAWNFSSNNFSFYGHYSPLLVTNVKSFTAPANATNCLFVVWVCNADFVGDIYNYLGGPNLGPPSGTNLTDWTAAINQHLTNHFKAITNLYAKGMRTLVAPNAVDIGKVVGFNNNSVAYKAFVRQRCISFNTNYAAMLKQIAANSPGLTIYSPDIFSLLDDIEANASKYGLTNALDASGYIADVLEVPALSPWAVNGAGTNYIFWSPQGDPTARFQAVIADTAQQMLSPVNIANITPVNTSNQLALASAPVGMKGIAEFLTDLSQTNWQTNSFFTVSNTAQTVFLNPTNSMRFYRVKFPWQWSWP